MYAPFYHLFLPLQAPWLETQNRIYQVSNSARSYPTTIASSLPPHWSIAEVLLSSSYRGWGTSSLAKDAKEIAECVEYFSKLRPGKKVVLMGHSTGCQDCLEYLVGEGE